MVLMCFGFLVCWVLLFAGVLFHEGSKCVHGPSVWGLSVCKVLLVAVKKRIFLISLKAGFGTR